MKQLSFLALFFFMIACEDKVAEIQSIDEPQPEQKEHHVMIIPDTPSSKDEVKLIIFDDCIYNILSEVKRKGKTIEIVKQFNSMMKLPCVLTNDTILIGKLPQGSYNVNYTLIDLSSSSQQNTFDSFTLQFDVVK
jgi:hypothetical protein